MPFSSGSFPGGYSASVKTARTLLFSALALAGAGAFSEVQAQCVSRQEARQVLQQGEAAPLPTALQNAGLGDAQVLDAQLCRSGGGWSYRVRYRQDGQVTSANIPAG